MGRFEFWILNFHRECYDEARQLLELIPSIYFTRIDHSHAFVPTECLATLWDLCCRRESSQSCKPSDHFNVSSYFEGIFGEGAVDFVSGILNVRTSGLRLGSVLPTEMFYMRSKASTRR